MKKMMYLSSIVIAAFLFVSQAHATSHCSSSTKAKGENSTHESSADSYEVDKGSSDSKQESSSAV